MEDGCVAWGGKCERGGRAVLNYFGGKRNRKFLGAFEPITHQELATENLGGLALCYAFAVCEKDALGSPPSSRLRMYPINPQTGRKKTSRKSRRSLHQNSARGPRAGRDVAFG